MELIDGLDVAQLVKCLGWLEINDACEIARQAAEGLHSAHEQGLIHRDIKPSNLMLARDGTVKVLDLGLARLCEDDESSLELTKREQLLGTVDYMAPEQAKAAGTVDRRADVYSLGCTLFTMVTGRVPFGGPTTREAWEKVMAHAKTPAPSTQQYRSEVPNELAAIVDGMLAKDPIDRPTTSYEVANALQAFSKECDLRRLMASATAKATGGSTILANIPTTVTREVAKPEMKGQATYTGSEAGHLAKKQRPLLSRPRFLLATAAVIALLFGAAAVVPQLLVRIKTRDGEVIEIKTPPGSTVSIVGSGEAATPATSRPFPGGESVPRCGSEWVTNPLNGHCYRLTEPGTWDEAEAEAVAAGGHLVTINDSDESRWLRSTFPSLGHVDEVGWIGLYQVPGGAEPNGGWEWISGESVDFTNWDSGEPNDLHGDENWAVLNDVPGGRWSDLNQHLHPRRGIIELAPNENAPTLSTFTTFAEDETKDYQLNAAARIVDGAVRLTPAGQNYVGSLIFSPVRTRLALSSFKVNFDFRIGGGTGADGLSFHLLDADQYTQYAVIASDTAPGTLTINFDTFQNDDDVNDNNIDIFWHDRLLGTYVPSFDLNDNEWRHAEFVVRDNKATLTLTRGREVPERVFADMPLKHSLPRAVLYGFGAWCGAVTDEHWIDNVRFSVFDHVEPWNELPQNSLFAHVERLRPKNSDAAEMSLRQALADRQENIDSLWDLWLAVCLVDLQWTPAQILSALPTLAEFASEPMRIRRGHIEWIMKRLHAQEPVRINCGGSSFRDRQGNEWAEDRFFRAGHTYENLKIDVQQTPDVGLYQTFRWFDTVEAQGPPEYRIPVPPGRYHVILHFAEITVALPDQRRFDVTIEGETVLDCYSPSTVDFATSDAISFETETTDGFLNIEFIQRPQYGPMINAIEVFAYSSAASTHDNGDSP